MREKFASFIEAKIQIIQELREKNKEFLSFNFQLSTFICIFAAAKWKNEYINLIKRISYAKRKEKEETQDVDPQAQEKTAQEQTQEQVVCKGVRKRSSSLVSLHFFSTERQDLS